MKRTLSDLARETIIKPEAQRADDGKIRQISIKKKLVASVDRSNLVLEGIMEWVLSFPSGMTKQDFTAQIIRLDGEDGKAIEQLTKSKGKRVLVNPPRIKPPKLTAEVIEALERNNAIAIEASSGRKVIEEFLESCPETGTYELDVNELVLEYVDYSHRGKAGEIISRANRAEILIILGLEKPISLAYHIRDTLFQIASVRAKDKGKYTITTWNYTHEWYMPDFKKQFTHYCA